MSRRRFVFVSSPYRNNPEENLERHKDYGNEVIDMGGFPILPLLLHYLEKKVCRERSTWLNISLALLEKADIVWIPEGIVTSGINEEEIHASNMKIPAVRKRDDLYCLINGSPAEQSMLLNRKSINI